MLSEGRQGEDGVFDPATVIGLNSNQHILVLGNPAFLPWLLSENNHVDSARKMNEAVKMVESNDFDKIIVGREFDFSHWTNIAIARVGLNAHRGTLVYFPKTEGEAWQFKQNVEFAFPRSIVWESNTTFGHVIQVDIRGEHIHA
jgi:hypothetical protein